MTQTPGKTNISRIKCSKLKVEFAFRDDKH